MDGFKAYKYYMAIKLHFTKPKYDVFKTRGNVRGSRDAFNSRNDRYIFEKLADKYSTDRDIIQFFVSIFAYGEGTEFYGTEADGYYELWRKRKESITNVFQNDLATTINICDIEKQDKRRLFKSKDGELPILLTLFLAGRISIETLSIINDIDPFIDDWENDTAVNLVLSDKLLRIKKLQGFVKYSKNKLTNTFNVFKEELSF